MIKIDNKKNDCKVNENFKLSQDKNEMLRHYFYRSIFRGLGIWVIW